MDVKYLFPLFWIAMSGGFTVDETVSPSRITLYQSSDVVNLFDDNMTMIYNTDTMWIIQFYNHWCGHCQRFAPIWKDLASDVKAWGPTVKIGAINCADQTCDRYQIDGTPTTRIFHPNTQINQMDSSYYGFDIPVKNGKDYYVNIILYNIAVASTKEGNININFHSRSEVPSRQKTDLQGLFSQLTDDIKHIVLIFDQDGPSALGKKVIMDMSDHTDVMAIMRFRQEDSNEWRPVPGVKMVVIDRDGDVVKEVQGLGTSDNRKDWKETLMSFVLEAPVVMALKSWRGQESSSLLVINKQSSTQKDLVHQSDLERAVKYSIMTEVAAQSYLSHAKFKALVDFVETLVNFFPNKTENLNNFLLSLLDWLRSNRYQSLSPQIYKAKVEELSDLWQPWGPASDTWASGGCAGSSPEKRGYPCALWTLFHSLMAASYDKDTAWSVGSISSVARSMVTYITLLFSCRDCARHFQEHVNTAVYRPNSPDNSLLWLWSIHNVANSKLAGDPTEDPLAPKVQWPTHENCPRCRMNNSIWNSLKLINGELWNEIELIKYIKSVYNPDNISRIDQIKMVLDELQEEIGHHYASRFEEAHKKLNSFCRKR